jgi:putative spermidine/putrescine transport system substrate-binding protein
MTSPLSRRAVLAVAAALPLAGRADMAAAQSAPVTIGWYPGLLGSYFRRSFLDTYSAGKDFRVVEAFDNARFTQMQANRSAPNLHVGVFTDVLLPLIARSGLLAELDPALIPNLRDLIPDLPRQGGKFSVPVTYGTWGIAYNAKRVKKPVTGWADLLSEGMKGYVSAPNITYNSSVYTLDAYARLGGGSLQAPDSGLEAMHRIRSAGPGLWDQESIAIGWLKSGEIWATPYFSGNVLAMMRDPDLADIRFCVPSEGGYALPMSVTRVVNSSAGQAPEAFINHMLGVEAQEAWARIGSARPVNAKARVPDDVAAVVPTIDKLRQIDWSYFAENRNAVVARWNSVVNR